MMENILQQIVDQRRLRIERMGPELGNTVPVKRKAPLIQFGRSPFVIAEIKRRSPSMGDIDSLLDPVGQARLYRSKGIQSVSVLTEEDHFSGSLTDLMEVKSALPSLSVLRKDFLLCEEDIDVSFRAGADAVLLLTSVLQQDILEQLYNRAVELGMMPLVEIHSQEDIRKAEPLRPMLTGINARDLTTFRVDPAHPIRLRSRIPWPATLVYESGIRGSETARLPGYSGFSGILVGEAVVRKPDTIPEIIKGFEIGMAEYEGGKDQNSAKTNFFWNDLFQPKKLQVPFIKICGLTRVQDVRAADEAGVDILGFILAEVSPRHTTTDFIRSIGATRALKAAVVVGTDPEQMAAVRKLLQEGALDAVQFHGDEAPDACAEAAYPYYKALPLRSLSDVEKIGDYHCPRVLIDAYYKGASGGTGKRIDDTLVKAAASKHPLWLAGGLSPENIAEVVEHYRPELVDASSGLETAPGIKDPDRIRRFVDAVHSIIPERLEYRS
ncbi:MAG: bifunctional indole-3-glycerol phosphate synthase/phosphoribosylanthranilate isomerase [Spirochaetaceae bacterium]|nr:bifunctional indole-3-glycerol phosphate synthase/phosphoribosylanthranilate isomerase [Spirochaetaceae bacterium]MCF7939864.1 bifunctional indole-3-glycerol phosphate synthase/phosphoribosylanthranilate isomerase [Spirochaetales bacterium]